MKIWHISDTHMHHRKLRVPDGIDLVIHSGDCSNMMNPYMNEQEVSDFLGWYRGLEIEHKIFVAGNHDTSIEKRLLRKIDIERHGISYLEDESIEIGGHRFWGSPYTPSFGYGWAFNMNRGTIHEIWDMIPADTDVVITHGPPRGILDLVKNRSYDDENVGCDALLDKMKEIAPKLSLFGHIHNNEGNVNAGVAQIPNVPTYFSNGSVVTDGEFGKTTSNGNIFELTDEGQVIWHK